MLSFWSCAQRERHQNQKGRGGLARLRAGAQGDGGAAGAEPGREGEEAQAAQAVREFVSLLSLAARTVYFQIPICRLKVSDALIDHTEPPLTEMAREMVQEFNGPDQACREIWIQVLPGFH